MSEITEREAIRGGTGRALIAAVALLAGTAAASVAGTIAPVAAASSISVFVGYADSTRHGGEFPNPWNGAPDLTFDGCAAQSACIFDSGAIRIRNDNATPVSVDQVSVHIGSCTYTWAGATYPISLAPGASLVATQRASIEAPGCTGPDPSTFDSSDIPSEGCTNDGIQSTIDVTIDGVTSSYVDSGQVLNTGGIDPAICSNSDESTQWVKVGDKPCSGQTLTLNPPTQTDPVDTTAMVSATLTNACGAPLDDVAVAFSVASGPNAGTSGSGVSDASGLATFSYTSAALGTDSLQAAVTNAVGFTRLSNTVAVIWIAEFAPGGGSFVIGDQSATRGSSVYFWGSQWAKRNSLSAGPAARSFKGFADEPAVPDCGKGWTSDPGNSTPPPDGPLPQLMAVIVTSSAQQVGPEISGHIVAIVLVRTDPGYEPNPGHFDTGVVVAVLCGSVSSTVANSPTPQPHQHAAAPPGPTSGATSAPGGSSAATACQTNGRGRSTRSRSRTCAAKRN